MHSRTELHEKIQELSSKIKDLNGLLANADKVSPLDIDLLRKHTIELYDYINHLSLARHQQEPEPKAKPLEKAEPVVHTPPPVIETPPVVHPPAPKPEPVAEIVPPVIEPEPVKPAVVETPPPPPVVETPVPKVVVETRHETDKKKEPSIHEKLSAGNEKPDLAQKLQQTPIPDLKKAISINKKFEFISHLFKGDHEAYAKAIHYLNGLENGTQAHDFMNKLQAENHWDLENKFYLDLEDLVRRRYL